MTERHDCFVISAEDLLRIWGLPAVTNEEVDEALYGKAERDEHGVPIKKEPERKTTTPSDDFATIARRMRELGLDK